MILPTPEFDPLFSNDDRPLRDRMIDYIRREFSELLGDRAVWLDNPDGLDRLSGSMAHLSGQQRSDAA